MIDYITKLLEIVRLQLMILSRPCISFASY